MGKTDSAGRHRLRLDFKSLSEPRTMVLRAEASVSDVNRQTWTSGVQFIVHSAQLYVGIRPRSRFMAPGTLTVGTIVSDIAGKTVAGRRVKVTAEPTSSSSGGKPASCLLTSAAEATRCALELARPGMYRVTATVSDDQQRRHKAVVYVWVAGGRLPGQKGLAADRVGFTLDKKTYQPGETAKVLVRLPFHPARGIVAVDRNGMLTRYAFSATTATKMVEVPLTMGHAPMTFVLVSVVGAAPRPGSTGPGKAPRKGKARPARPLRPAHAYGQVRLDVRPRERILGVKVRPAALMLEPGASTSVEVAVADAAGKPVAGAEVALVAVDESVLALGGYKIPDPIAGTFYSKSLYYGSVTRDELRRWVRLQSRKKGRQHAAEMADDMARPRPSKMARRAGRRVSGGAKAVSLRQNFNPLAVFAPTATTNRQGIARVS
ncbi:MAG: hypothetical protein KAI47_21865, partial [Deltaproteobacteria bacterium]|nr:hypothetical protein [Deltaproteobacteria bacterium]